MPWQPKLPLVTLDSSRCFYINQGLPGTKFSLHSSKDLLRKTASKSWFQETKAGAAAMYAQAHPEQGKPELSGGGLGCGAGSGWEGTLAGKVAAELRPQLRDSA